MSIPATPNEVSIQLANPKRPHRWALVTWLHRTLLSQRLKWSPEDRIEAVWRARRTAEANRNCERHIAWSRRRAVLRA
ncbi:hypothetical protein CKO28_00865 [Rhodovibrio sodomensis]|uniref:Uncharacterized protein n=1 Tax=Rhodovibrio sodomensis TaxID=1088 RepID=A0ABS1DA16_9PROT|nr:hypothetical protein [Rhodovibrio sodomensis]MBK1666593.1 hypothetical protein [Rhodovibrio sodomensis]